MKKLGEFPGLIDGTSVEIWYMRPDFFREGINGDMTRFDPNDLTKTHILLGTIGGVSPRYGKSENCPLGAMTPIYTAMQGEHWSPSGEANDFILDRGLGHTSMSVGDLARFAERNEAFVVKDIGFTKYNSKRD